MDRARDWVRLVVGGIENASIRIPFPSNQHSTKSTRAVERCLCIIPCFIYQSWSKYDRGLYL